VSTVDFYDYADCVDYRWVERGRTRAIPSLGKEKEGVKKWQNPSLHPPAGGIAWAGTKLFLSSNLN